MIEQQLSRQFFRPILLSAGLPQLAGVKVLKVRGLSWYQSSVWSAGGRWSVWEGRWRLEGLFWARNQSPKQPPPPKVRFHCSSVFTLNMCFQVVFVKISVHTKRKSNFIFSNSLGQKMGRFFIINSVLFPPALYHHFYCALIQKYSMLCCPLTPGCTVYLAILAFKWVITDQVRDDKMLFLLPHSTWRSMSRLMSGFFKSSVVLVHTKMPGWHFHSL